jgi:uncharacterized protein (TIGR00255 family)
MVYSMTGYGRGEHESCGMKFSVEAKSVNHRYCDIAVKLPRTMSYLESRLKQLAMKYVSRGKMDIYVSYDEFGTNSTDIRVDDVLADAYYQALNHLNNRFVFTEGISLASFSQMPGILTAEKNEVDEEVLWEILCIAAEAAFKSLKLMRESEGSKLKSDILDKLSAIKGALVSIEARAPLVVVEYRAKLMARIKELIGQQEIPLDEGRLVTEVAIFADRSGVDEEIVRLKCHIDQVGKCLALAGPIGRKLDFIVQEMNRESNTIGSKSNDIEINMHVVELTSEIEKIREQVQNIE